MESKLVVDPQSYWHPNSNRFMGGATAPFWTPNVSSTIAPDRSKWDKFYLDMTRFVSQMSKDPSTKTGCVIVRPDKTVASIGFNGFPMGCDDDEELYADRELKYERIVHADTNAILHLRERAAGYTMYLTDPPCARCTTNIIQSGIIRIVHWKGAAGFIARWADNIKIATQMCTEAGVQVMEYEEHVNS